MARDPKGRLNRTTIVLVFLLLLGGAVGVGALLIGFGNDRTDAAALAEGAGAGAGGGPTSPGAPGGASFAGGSGGRFEAGFLPAAMTTQFREASAWALASGLPAEQTGVTAAFDTCPPVASVLATIAEAASGASINEIVAALSALDAAAADTAAPSGLALQMRAVLRASGATEECQSTGIAIRQALDLARLAAAEATVVTAATTPTETIPDTPTSFTRLTAGNATDGAAYN